MDIQQAKTEFAQLNQLISEASGHQQQWLEGRLSGFIQWVLKPNGWWKHNEIIGEDTPIWE